MRKIYPYRKYNVTFEGGYIKQDVWGNEVITMINGVSPAIAKISLYKPKAEDILESVYTREDFILNQEDFREADVITNNIEAFLTILRIDNILRNGNEEETFKKS